MSLGVSMSIRMKTATRDWLSTGSRVLGVLALLHQRDVPLTFAASMTKTSSCDCGSSRPNVTANKEDGKPED